MAKDAMRAKDTEAKKFQRNHAHAISDINEATPRTSIAPKNSEGMSLELYAPVASDEARRSIGRYVFQREADIAVES